MILFILVLLLATPIAVPAQENGRLEGKTSYCGKDTIDAKKCTTPCPSGGGCPFGEACFLNTECPTSVNNGHDTMVPLQSGTTTTTGIDVIHSTFTSMKNAINTQLFLYETPMMEWVPSTVYSFDGFFDGLKVMHTQGVAGQKIYLGGHENGMNEGCEHCFMYGLVNVAAFLAQAMKETIRYDACDENSWDRVGADEMYPISNACGQLGQSYQDYQCSEEERHMECPVDPQMTITAVTNAKWWGAPGPLKCGPKSLYPQTGYWDFMYDCDNPWATPPETCDEYEGQVGGKAINNVAYANAAGRTDVEGCCWWGRGVIQTSGVCNFGKLNYFLGKRAADEGRESRYPNIDFCKDPEAICRSTEAKELKWIAGLFYWINSVQTYDEGGWNYLAELHKYVEGGMQGDSFINAVSGIVNRGCHNPPCGTGDLDGGPERAQNFKKVVDEMRFSFVDVLYPVNTQQSVQQPAPAPQPSVPEPIVFIPPPTPPEIGISISPPSVETFNPPTLSNPALPDESYSSAGSTLDIGMSGPSMVRFTCGDGYQAADDSELSIPPSTEVAFDYEIHNGLDVPVVDALKDVKTSMLTDIASRMGCQKTFGRKLQQSNVFGSIIGLQSNAHDLPDPDASGCMVDVDTEDHTTCTPVSGGFIIYAKPGTSELSLAETTHALQSIIQTGMDSGKYETADVDKAIYIGERDNLSKPQASTVPVNMQTEESEGEGIHIAIYILACVCLLLLCLLCFAIWKYRERKKQLIREHDEEMAFGKFMMEQDGNHQQNRMNNNGNIMMAPPHADDYLQTQSTRQMNQNPSRRNVFEDNGSGHEMFSHRQTAVPRRKSFDRMDRRVSAPAATASRMNQEVPDFISGQEDGFSDSESLTVEDKMPVTKPQRSKSAPRFQVNKSRRRMHPPLEDRMASSDGERGFSDSSSSSDSSDDEGYNDTEEKIPSAPRRSMNAKAQSSRRPTSSDKASSSARYDKSMESLQRNSSSAKEERQRRMAQARARASKRRSA